MKPSCCYLTHNDSYLLLHTPIICCFTNYISCYIVPCKSLSFLDLTKMSGAVGLIATVYDFCDRNVFPLTYSVTHYCDFFSYFSDNKLLFQIMYAYYDKKKIKDKRNECGPKLYSLYPVVLSKNLSFLTTYIPCDKKYLVLKYESRLNT